MKTIVTLTGPSGSGKSTLANRLINEHGFKNVVSHTTRSPRGKEEDGKDYFFISEQQFKQMLKEWKFVEHVTFNGKYYGLSTEVIDNIHEGKGTPVVVVEPNGLKQIDQYCRDNDIRLLSVYIGGDLETLINRILTRDLVGATSTAPQYGYLAKRIASLVNELDTWAGAFPYSLSYTRYNHETDEMIVDTIVSNMTDMIVYMTDLMAKEPETDKEGK